MARVTDLEAAAETARDLAARAAPVALDLQGRAKHRDKGGGEGPVSEADYAVEKIVLAGLREAFPDDAIVSEESPPPPSLAHRRLWCIDPIDGTREYLEGLPEYAIMIGLLVDGEPRAGAMALPGAGQVFWGWRGGGAFLDGKPLSVPPAPPLPECTVIHSRTHKGPRLEEALRRLAPRRTIAAGGVGYKVAQILLGRAHVYVHPRSGVHWWDSVAPAAILLAAGGTVATAAGAPLRYEGTTFHEEGLLFAAPAAGAGAAARLTVRS